MPYALPPLGSKADTHMSPHVHECLAQPERLPTRKEAAASAANCFRSTQSGAAGLYSMTLLWNDDVALCFYGVRGGFHVVWNFGRA